MVFIGQILERNTTEQAKPWPRRAIGENPTALIPLESSGVPGVFWCHWANPRVNDHFPDIRGWILKALASADVESHWSHEVLLSIRVNKKSIWNASMVPRWCLVPSWLINEPNSMNVNPSFQKEIQMFLWLICFCIEILKSWAMACGAAGPPRPPPPPPNGRIRPRPRAIGRWKAVIQSILLDNRICGCDLWLQACCALLYRIGRWSWKQSLRISNLLRLCKKYTYIVVSYTQTPQL